MGELTAADVELFTKERLLASDTETVRMLNAALTVARRYVGWHVSPVKVGDVMTLDGPDSRILFLPTRKVNTLTSIVEDGTTLTLSDLRWSAGGPPGLLERTAAVRKKSNAYWSEHYASIVVTMTHGYTEVEAADWRQAVLSMVDQMSLLPVGASTGRSDADLMRKQVDDVEYQWGPGSGSLSMAEQTLFSVTNILDDYLLPRVELF